MQDITTYKSGIASRSLIKYISPSRISDNDEEEFKDALGSEEDLKRSLLNEFELSVSIIK